MDLSKADILSTLRSEKPFLEEQFAIVQLGLFGSYSNNKHTELSDIDIAFELKPGQEFTLEKKVQLENYFKALFKKEVDLVRLKYLNPVVRFKMEDEVIYV